MVQFIPAKDDWADAFRQIGSGVSKGYMNRSDDNSIKKAIEDLGPNASARDVLDALTKTKTYGNESKQQAIKNYLGADNFEEMKRKAKAQEDIASARNDIAQAKEAREGAKEQTERTNVQSIVNQLDLPPEKKESLGQTLTQNAAESLLKEQLKPKDEKLTPGQKKIQEKNAEEYVSLTKEIPELETNAADIDYAEKLSKELGLTGVVTGALGLSGKGKELEASSFTLMKPIVKIFNPSGPIAQQKLKMIQDKYVIKASDAPWTKQAKIDALRRFNNQALKRAKDRMELFQRYDANPPIDALEKFDKESDTMSDVMIDYDLQGQEATSKDLPKEVSSNASKFKGQTITSPDGQKYFSDGTRWIKK